MSAGSSIILELRITPKWTLELGPSYVIDGSPRHPEPLPDEGARLVARLIGGAGELLTERRLHGTPGQSALLRDKPPEVTFRVVETLPWDPTARSVELLLDGTPIPEPCPLPDEDPTLGSVDARVEGQAGLVVDWEVTPPETPVLLRYSVDNGATWLPLGADLIGPRAVFDIGGYPAGSAAVIQVTASGARMPSTTLSPPFASAASPPTLSILGPLPGGTPRVTLTDEQMVDLVAAVAPPRPYPEDAFVWRARQGNEVREIGRGRRMLILGADLQQGLATVTVELDGQPDAVATFTITRT